jgi:phytoene synthase
MQESKNITRKSKSNLTLGFFFLTQARRDGMAALYAFCREVDDVADDESVPVEQRRVALAKWREDIRRACEGETPQFTTNREFQPVIARYHLPFEYFDELIRGVEMDLDIKRYENFAELEKYCYRVASVVGLLSIEIFGYSNAACRDYAVYLGKALQLTNILRDVKTDAERGRIYLPLNELARFKVTEEEILRGQYSDRFEALARSASQQARKYYQLARQTLPSEDRRSMTAAESMGSVYWKLLQKIERQKFDVFGPETTRLNKAQKLAVIFKTWLRIVSGAVVPNYGTP